MKLKLVFILFGLLLAALPASAQDSTPEPPHKIGLFSAAANDGDGVQVITGEYDYSDPDLPSYGLEPMIFLGDMSRLFDGTYVYSTEYVDMNSPQVLGRITSDIDVAPFTYEIRLPIDPGGRLHDVDHNGKADRGVMVYNVNFGFSTVGDQYLQAQDVVFDSSDTRSDNFDTPAALNGGKLVIYAPDDEQSFPSGFGPDGLLFTDDDPIAAVQQGYTVVDLDADPFGFDRARTVGVDIIEDAIDTISDFSDLSYTEAFDAVIDMLRTEYAYSDLYNLDWDAIAARYRPRFEQAQEDDDAGAYELALQDLLTTEIPDGHIGLTNAPYLYSLPFPPPEIAGGIGMTIRQLDDGRVLVNYLLSGGPADKAGIALRADILEIDGVPIGDAISGASELNPPYSVPELKQLDQERSVVRFPIGAQVELSYRNPGDRAAKTVTLTAIDEDDSRSVSIAAVYGPLPDTNLPIEFRTLASGYGYIVVHRFDDDGKFTLDLWRRALQTFDADGVPGIILDLRYNGGGFDNVGNAMLSYLFDEPETVGQSAYYFPDQNKILVDASSTNIILPVDDLHYHGKIAVLISPGCFSECEMVSFALAYTGRAKLIGQFPTGGLGGFIKEVNLPGDVSFQFTVGSELDPDGNIVIQGKGVPPDITVPVNEATVFSEGDPILNAAEAYLDEATTLVTQDGGPIEVGQSLSATLPRFTADQYTLTPTKDVTVNITLGDADESLDTYLIVYDADGNVLAENDEGATNWPNSEITDLELEAGETVTIEASTWDATDSGDYTLTVEAAR